MPSLHKDSAPSASDRTSALVVSSVAERVSTLGPAPSAVIWTQGCDIGCSGCMSTHTWAKAGAAVARVDDIARWLESLSTRSLVLSGGEPTQQASAVHSLLDRLDTDWVVTMYTGLDWPAVTAHSCADIARLARRVDLVIAGPYVPALHAPLLWRGSSNQQLVDISGRIDIPVLDASVGVEVEISSSAVTAIGVPPERGFSNRLRTEMADTGIELRAEPSTTFPFPTTQLEN